MSVFYFVAGEQVITIKSRNVLDAWLNLSIRARKQPVASEYRQLPIEAYDASGKVIGKRTWQQWEDAVLSDTYGVNFREVIEAAALLAK